MSGLELEDKIKLGLLIFVVAGGFGLFAHSQMKEAKAVDEVSSQSIEIIHDKMIEDIREVSEIPLSDDFTIDLTGINLEDGKGLIAKEEKNISLFGISNEKDAYKLTYDLNDEQLNEILDLAKYLNNRTLKAKYIENLTEILVMLELSHIEVKDLEAFTLGLTKEEEFTKLAEVFGPAIETNKKNSRSHHNKEAKVFMPIYSSVKVIENNGEYVALMNLDGLEFHSERSSGLAGGIAMGGLIGQSIGNPAVGMMSGIGMSSAFAKNMTHVYSRSEQIVVKINSEEASLSEQELRNLVMDALINDSKKYVTQTTKRSEDLMYRFDKVVDKLNENKPTR